MRNKYLLLSFLLLATSSHAESLVIGQCYSKFNSDPFEHKNPDYGCVLDLRRGYVRYFVRHYSDLSNEWICHERSARVDFFDDVFDIVSPFKANDLRCETPELLGGG